MTHAFTPGPWIFDEDNVGVTPHYGYALYAPDFETGEEFCYVLCSVEKTRRLGEGVPKANAILIAAAPDMYEALKNLLADIEEYQAINHLGGYDNHYQVAARDALAKAEGRQP